MYSFKAVPDLGRLVFHDIGISNYYDREGGIQRVKYEPPLSHVFLSACVEIHKRDQP